MEVDAEGEADVPVTGRKRSVVSVGREGCEREFVGDGGLTVEFGMGEPAAVFGCAEVGIENFPQGHERRAKEPGRQIVAEAIDGHDAGGNETVGAESGIESVV